MVVAGPRSARPSGSASSRPGSDSRLRRRRCLRLTVLRRHNPTLAQGTSQALGVPRVVRLFRRGGMPSGDRVRHGLVIPARTWEDYLMLGVTEIRESGSSSLQVMRRMRAMLEDLRETSCPRIVPQWTTSSRGSSRRSNAPSPNPSTLIWRGSLTRSESEDRAVHRPSAPRLRARQATRC